MVLVLYYLPRDAPFEGKEEQTPSCFDWHSEQITLHDIKQVFPETGEYHFRRKTADPRRPQEYPHRFVWEDLTDLSESFFTSDQMPLEIKALPINLESNTYNSTPNNMHREESGARHDTVERNGNPKARQVKRPESSMMERPQSMKEDAPKASRTAHRSVSKQKTRQRSATPPPQIQHNVRNALKSGVSFFKASADLLFSGNNNLPNTAQQNLLRSYTDLLFTKLTQNNTKHVSHLKSIWKTAFPGEEFVAVGPQWQLLGFENDDVSSDTKVIKTGLLGIKALQHCASTCPYLITTQSNISQYLAPLCLSTTLALVDIFGIRDSSYKRKKNNFWKLFQRDPNVFFCVATFTTRIAVQNFGAKIGGKNRIKKNEIDKAVECGIDVLLNVLQEGPGDFDEVEQIANALGIQF